MENNLLQPNLENIPKKWGFDQKEIAKYITILEKLLTKENLSQEKIETINLNLQTLKFYQNKNYNMETFSPDKETFQSLKEKTLEDMQALYYLLKDDLLNWLIELRNTNIFATSFQFKNYFVPIETQIKYTLKNYEKHSKILLPPTKKLFFNKSQFQLVKNVEYSSYYINLSTIKKAFFVINPNEAGCILNHEIEHYLEGKLMNIKNDIYLELGSIYFELLFTDIYYQEENKFLKSRVENINDDLEEIIEYIEIIKEFKKHDFQISDELFIETFIKYKEVIPEEINEYLQEEIDFNYMIETFIYFLSFLKALELRKITESTKEDSFNLLKPFLTSQSLSFAKTNEQFYTYESYINEVKQKTLK